MNKMAAFFKTHGANILSLTILFVTVLVLFNILGVDFNPDAGVKKHISKIVTMESFI